MPDGSTLALFLIAAVMLAVVPGPAVLYIVAQSVGGGRGAGLVSTLGIAAGALVHVVAATVGLSSLLLSSATAYEVVKYAGAAYLILLGIRRLLARDVPATPAARRRPLARLFANGVVVNVLNPKLALFFLALLPQFVDRSAGRPALQFAVLGLLWVVTALATDSLYALAAGSLGGRVRGAVRAQRWAAGGVFIGLGAATALSGGRRD